MKRFKDWITNELLESSFSRVYQHTKERNLGIISAFRGDLPASENNKRHKELKDAVRKAGYGYIRIKGRYVENHGTPNARNVDEKALMVVGKKGDDKGSLKGFLSNLGSKYGQDSILHKSYNETDASLYGTNDTGWPGKGKAHKLGKWHPNRVSEFHSVMRGGKKPFTFESYLFLPEKSFFIRENRPY